MEDAKSGERSGGGLGGAAADNTTMTVDRESSGDSRGEKHARDEGALVSSGDQPSKRRAYSSSSNGAPSEMPNEGDAGPDAASVAIAIEKSGAGLGGVAGLPALPLSAQLMHAYGGSGRARVSQQILVRFMSQLSLCMKSQSFSAGDVVFTSGDASSAMYFIRSGGVNVCDVDGKTVLDTMSAGSFFGEVGLLLGIPRVCTVRTSKDSELFVLQRDDFFSTLLEFPQVASHIQSVGNERVKLRERFRSLAFLSLDDRTSSTSHAKSEPTHAPSEGAGEAAPTVTPRGDATGSTSAFMRELILAIVGNTPNRVDSFDNICTRIAGVFPEIHQQSDWLNGVRSALRSNDCFVRSGDMWTTILPQLKGLLSDAAAAGGALRWEHALVARPAESATGAASGVSGTNAAGDGLLPHQRQETGAGTRKHKRGSKGTASSQTGASQMGPPSGQGQPPPLQPALGVTGQTQPPPISQHYGLPSLGFGAPQVSVPGYRPLFAGPVEQMSYPGSYMQAGSAMAPGAMMPSIPTRPTGLASAVAMSATGGMAPQGLSWGPVPHWPTAGPPYASYATPAPEMYDASLIYRGMAPVQPGMQAQQPSTVPQTLPARPPAPPTPRSEASSTGPAPANLSEPHVKEVSYSVAKILAELSSSGARQPEFRILLVEDNEIAQRAAAKIIRDSGFAFDVAANGKEALERMETSRYSLVLMDCQMPTMDGYTATKYIRMYEGSTGAHTPVVALTAFAAEDVKTLCFESGMDGFMLKPMSKHALKDVVSKWARLRM